MGCITSQESKTVTPDASLADSTDGIGNRTTGLRYLTHGPDGRHMPAGQDTKDSGDKAGTTGSRRDQREIKMANTATALTEPGVEENVLREVGVSKIGSSLPNDDSALDRDSLASRAEFSRTNAHAPVHSSFTQVQVGLRWPEWFEKESQDISRHGAPRHIKDFKKVRRIGRGAYSTVYLGLDLGEGKFVAMKKMHISTTTTNVISKVTAREVDTLASLNHPNIVRFMGCAVSTHNMMYICLEYLECDLNALIQEDSIAFTDRQNKVIARSVLGGLDYMHSSGMVHRDLKPSNVLINLRGQIKLADFGMACRIDSIASDKIHKQVVTLWYRPLELLLGVTTYTETVDLFSCGCLIGELYAKRPIIKGHNEVEQIHRLLQLCGSWEEGYAEKINLKNDKLLWTLTKKYPSRLHDIPNITVEATKLLEIIMNVQPERRGTAFGALRHEYFDQLDSGDNSQRLGDNDVGGIVRSIMASRNACEMSDTADFSGKGDTGEVTHENE